MKKKLLATVDGRCLRQEARVCTCVGHNQTQTLQRPFSDRNAPFPLFQVHMSVYFLGHVFFLVAFLSVPYLRKALVPKKERGPSKQD